MRRTLLNGVFGAFLALAAGATEAGAAIRYVKASAGGANNGTSWGNAYTSLQQALVDAIAGDEIWVSVGTYKPSSPGGRSSTFQLRNNIAIYGGFRGQSGDEGVNDATTRPPDPDPATANPATDSVLSGDLNGDDGANFANYGENVYHVVTGNATDSTARLIGFTIKGGNASLINGVDDRGGGLRNDSGNAVIQDCRFIANESASFAGAAFNPNSGSAYTNCLFLGNAAPRRGGAAYAASTNQFTNCTFQSNECVDGGAEGLGGALQTAGTPSIVNCTFKNNVGRRGGAIFAESTDLRITGCLFDTNYAHNGGGAIHTTGIGGSVSVLIAKCDFFANEAVSNSSNGGAIASYSGAVLRCVNCRFLSNRAITGASASGGAVFHDGGAATLTNCVLEYNAASHGAALYNLSGSITVSNATIHQNGSLAISNSCGSSIEIYNSIVWGNGSPVLEGCGPAVAFCDFQGGYSGNPDFDPRFIDADGPDNIGGNLDDNLRLAPYSRCIDAGRNSDVPADSADLDGDSNTAEPTPYDLDGAGGPGRFLNSAHICDTGSGSAPLVDIGAYENDGVWSNPGVIYVSGSATGADNGTSWGSAFKYLQSALSAASDLEAACPGTALQIWVARHNVNPPYHPSLGSGLSGGDRTASYSLINNVKLYGGFSGSETLLSQRNLASPTSISGDWLANGFSGRTDDSLHVFRAGPSINATAVLDGFSIFFGNADGGGADANGAVLYSDGSPTIANCYLYYGVAADKGGGIYSTGSPRITSCTIQNNTAQNGGGLYSSNSMVVSKSVFQNNTAVFGGGIYTDGTLDLVNTVFRYNLVSISGGAVIVASGVPARLTNCSMAGNSAQYGAGLYEVSGATVTFSNCTLNENRMAYYNCATCGGTGIWNNGGTLTLNNSLLWGNQGLNSTTQYNQVFANGGTILANRNCIQGYFSLSGSGNFGDDPRMRDADGPDNFAGDSDDNMRLLSISPCIDRGNETLLPADVADLDGDNDTTEPVPYDLDGNPRRYDLPSAPDLGVGTPPLVDIGAYEFSSGDPNVCITGVCFGDMNGDFMVNGADVQLFVNKILSGGTCP